jgi:putative restriction endonuclease
LLLAVMDMVGRGQIVNRFVSIIGELTELTMLFTNYWRSLMPAVQTSSIAFPFSRLNSEPFWELVPLPEKEITQAAVNCISTVSQLRQLALGANLDEELFVLMTQEKSRAKLINAILQACFSEEGCRILVREMGIQ